MVRRLGGIDVFRTPLYRCVTGPWTVERIRDVTSGEGLYRSGFELSLPHRASRLDTRTDLTPYTD